VILAQDLVRRLAGLDDVGTGPTGVNRLAWTAPDAAAGDWFAAQAAAIGLRAERDAAGNRWALPEGDGPWWGLGSHLDSVRDGGRLDGPLGVAAAFAVAARTPHPVCVVAFADEEGARFNTPTFGSRALAGRLDADDALARRDDGGTSLAEAMRAAGVDPERLEQAPAALGRLRGFLELHIDQSRDLERAGAPVGVVAELAARERLEVELRGAADHAGTTPPDERADALLAAARLVVAADEGARPPVRVAATRILAEPNAPTAVAARVRLWLDARAGGDAPQDALAAWDDGLRAHAGEIAARGGVEIAIALAASSPAIAFDAGVRAALRVAADAPELTCFAGHDAGILAGAGVPAGMVLVRNPTGVSHAPAEDVSPQDAAAAATALLAALDTLHGT
jgi:beta-ureidopropionase / N-carbamoyl-L-amino-acid hydrolase